MAGLWGCASWGPCSLSVSGHQLWATLSIGRQGPGPGGERALECEDWGFCGERGKEAGQHGLWEEAWEGSQREADWRHPYRK